MFEICFSLSRVVVAVAPTYYEEIYREQIRQLSHFSLKLFGGNVTCKCLKFSFSSLFLLKIRPLPTKKAYKYVIKESVPFFRLLASLLVLLLVLSKFPFLK
jgi:hypothetical protein